MIRRERKQKVTFMNGNIKKFTIYEIHNRAASAVTATGQHVFSYTVLLLQWQVNTAVILVPVGGYNQQENLLSQLYSPELCHVKNNSIHINFNWGGGSPLLHFISPPLFEKRAEILMEMLNGVHSASKEQRDKVYLWQKGVKNLPRQMHFSFS